ncbi:MAG: guanylate kinase [Bulleidia sp.]|nr:guanylate kinase [Erysipelotrichaceae bacterium]MDY2780798.1 guanylate kinase [Bulleidia sp.]
MAKGLLIVISGPSGVGKGTVLKEVVKDPELNIGYSISMTTREKRPGEENGVNYYFVTRDEFHKAVEDGELLEWTEFVGNCYGTPIKEVERLRNEGKNVLLEIEQDGCSQVRKKVPDTLSIFIIPPSMEELERRIRSRKTEPEEIVQQRLAKAAKEMNNLKDYKYVVCNEDVKLAADIIRVIILRHMQFEKEKEDNKCL